MLQLVLVVLNSSFTLLYCTSAVQILCSGELSFRLSFENHCFMCCTFQFHDCSWMPEKEVLYTIFIDRFQEAVLKDASIWILDVNMEYEKYQCLLEEILFVLPRVWTVDQPALPCPSMTVGRGHLLVLSAAAQAVLDGQFTVYSVDFDLTWSIYHNIVFAALAPRIFPGGLETCSRGAADP